MSLVFIFQRNKKVSYLLAFTHDDDDLACFKTHYNDSLLNRNMHVLFRISGGVTNLNSFNCSSDPTTYLIRTLQILSML